MIEKMKRNVTPRCEPISVTSSKQKRVYKSYNWRKNTLLFQTVRSAILKKKWWKNRKSKISRAWNLDSISSRSLGAFVAALWLLIWVFYDRQCVAVVLKLFLCSFLKDQMVIWRVFLWKNAVFFSSLNALRYDLLLSFDIVWIWRNIG